MKRQNPKDHGVVILTLEKSYKSFYEISDGDNATAKRNKNIFLKHILKLFGENEQEYKSEKGSIVIPSEKELAIKDYLDLYEKAPSYFQFIEELSEKVHNKKYEKFLSVKSRLDAGGLI